MMLNGLFLLHFQEGQSMWVGWNAKKESHTFRKTQKIFYLPQIAQSPTSKAVAAGNLKRTLKFANHFKKESVAVTYDLAITKTAMQIKPPKHQHMIKCLLHWGFFILSCLSSVL